MKEILSVFTKGFTVFSESFIKSQSIISSETNLMDGSESRFKAWQEEMAEHLLSFFKRSARIVGDLKYLMTGDKAKELEIRKISEGMKKFNELD